MRRPDSGSIEHANFIKYLGKAIMATSAITGIFNDAFETNPDSRISSLKLTALLLAGGDGTRLQELTRAITGVPIPKQYCHLLCGASLLELTLQRAHLFAAKEDISVIINHNHLPLAEEQLRSVPKSNIFVQPFNRDTGPGLIFSILNLERLHGDAIVAVFPTDHFIANSRIFVAHVRRAAQIIQSMPEKIAILGITPDRPETGYGYIQTSDPLEGFENTFSVQSFTEKPSPHVARYIISRGGLWNTFVMVFRLSRMMELLREFVPGEFEQLSALRESPGKAAELYKDLGSWNLSTRLLARIPEHLITIQIEDVRWSDWGTRESIERTFQAMNLVPFWNKDLPGLSQP
jgi:mannose-1-phosphate guanylyltransferase